MARPDRAGLERATRLFLAAIGERSLIRDMRKTPRRVAEAWAGEILSGYAVDPARVLGTAFASRDRGMVVVRDIPFVSVCVHHLLPFHGTAHVAYLPAGRIVGLSKMARLVNALARRLQLQERLTRQVTAALDSALVPRGAACRIEAEHLCMTMRGARTRGARVVTTAYTGAFERSAALRAEFLRLSAPSRRRG
jgi:GTP cyclohydrolase I